MKSADDFLNLIDRGVSASKALSSLPQCELQYIAQVPIGIHIAARLLGWRFFPVWRTRSSPMSRIFIDRATSDLKQLETWAQRRPEWALATGAQSGVFAVVVDGDRGRNSLLQLCEDDWDWLFTLRTQGGRRRYILYAWPENERRIPASLFLGEGLSILGEGEWLLFPPSREANGVQHVFLTRSTVTQAPAWLLDSISSSKEVARNTRSRLRKAINFIASEGNATRSMQ